MDNTDHQASAGPDRPLLLLLVAVGLVVFGLLFGVRVLQGGPPAEATVVGNLSVAEPVPIPGDVVVVAQPGDSLWSIAQSIAPDSDPRPVVAALIEANGGDSVRIGQEIVIPQQLLD
ncbi:MAG: LysM domain-containing protein [Actinomycetota bacterium]